MNFDQIKNLMDVLQNTASDCLSAEQIDTYVQAQLIDQDDATFNPIRHHLDACVDCAEQYAVAYDVGFEAQVAQIPQPKLDFLKRDTTLLNQLLDACVRTVNQLRVQFSRELNARLTPPPLAVSRSRGRYRRPILQLSAEDTTLISPHLPFSIAAFEDSENPNNCLIEIKVRPPHKSWPDLAGYQVALSLFGTASVQTTDAHGEVIFADVAVAALQTMQIIVSSAPQSG